MDHGRVREFEQEQQHQQRHVAEALAAEARQSGDPLSLDQPWKPARGVDRFETCLDRRAFTKAGAALLGSLALSYPLQEFMARRAYGAAITSPYGTPQPTIDLNTGLPLISLPPGFRYRSFGWTGDLMNGGLATPGLHDGMAVGRQIGNRVILIRNHEVGAGNSYAGGAIQYSPGGGGGNTNLMFNTVTEKVENVWASLSGTIRNCAGGVTPWGSWLSGEETGGTSAGGTKTHGWVFDVPAMGIMPATPLTALGRFSHEALVVDPASGIVYETEDAGDTSGFYRFVPETAGNLRTGELQMLKVVGTTQADLRGLGSSGSPAFNPSPGQTWDVEWVDVPDPLGNPTSCFGQGFAAGGVRFRRLEGCWYGSGKIYFLSTSGGIRAEGTVFAYDPQEETLKLIYDSGDFQDVDNPDNMVVTPRGGLLLCEDAAGGQNVTSERMIGLTLEGQTFTFAENLLDFRTGGPLGGSYARPGGGTFSGDSRGQEWAGACYSPDGKWLFVNIQTPGITFAITGPWESGPL